MAPLSIVWFRQDLRLADNPALEAAARRGGPVVAVYVWSPAEEGAWPPGAASRWWLHHSLKRLDESLRRLGVRLILRRGPALEALRALARETGAAAVYWNRRYEPAVIERDRQVKEALRASGYQAESFNGALLFEPWTVQNRAGKPFQVFSAFWRTCLAFEERPEPLPAPTQLAGLRKRLESLPLAALELEPRIDWAGGLRAAWQPGESGAAQLFEQFSGDPVIAYGGRRDRPDLPGTSRLSPHLHFGEISPRQVWHGIRRTAQERRWKEWRASAFLTEIGWREFAHHLLFHFPHTPELPLRDEFARFPWRDDSGWIEAWQRGRTGYPLVDAGMRELWTTGWMHNRVRMIVASFLVKDLLVPWQTGARWFWDTLVDADLANNTLGWQWTAGCGADAAPFFRIFNPVSQGGKFDPEGDYVRRWAPELARLPARWIHQPWEAPPGVLADAGVNPGGNYPERIISHGIARERAMEAFRKLKE